MTECRSVAKAEAAPLDHRETIPIPWPVKLDPKLRGKAADRECRWCQYRFEFPKNRDDFGQSGRDQSARRPFTLLDTIIVVS
jgi:hypothetical protein